ncbi:ABC transporter ATP-binding protein [Pseudonocardia lacus]|uniref:ABC transporter ATP-binding protein n=1 Tax=Pseudonocardia lacus TaxID=2835865 RepID=UPI001BDD9263|nr:ABC transporter ATP-binding protein [Pseudonocardia lacus]
MPELEIENLRKSFGDNTVLHDLSLTVPDGQITTLLGPSGCGKSTTLWSIAGLHRPDSGRISFGGRVVFDGARIDLPPERRNCGVVFQSYAVWPHMTVFDNVAYPLKLRKVRSARRRERVLEVLGLVELGDHVDRYPHQLSGGQQQRVALARALAHPPDMLLLDEPFSNLDAKLRDRSRDWLRSLQQRVGVTTVFVTHDQDEALSMSDQVVVMSGGEIRQIGTPRDVYENPADLFVADFVGTANILDATTLAADGTTATVRLDGLADPLRVPHAGTRTGAVSVTIRPEAVHIVRAGEAAGPNTVTAKVETVSYLGDHYRYVLRLGGARLVATTTRPVDGTEMTVRLAPGDLRLFEPETTPDHEQEYDDE